MASATPARLTVPALAKPGRIKPLVTDDKTLDNGLRVVAVRRSTVPMVELRLRIPLLSAKAGHLARTSLLAEAILTGTERYDRLGLAIHTQEIGGHISVGDDADWLMISASALADRLPDLLALIAEVLRTASYPADEVAGERDRLLERITMARSQASVIANEALGRLLAPGHPYSEVLPSPDEVAATTAAQLRRLHAQFVTPRGASLVVVGDIRTAKVLDTAAEVFAAWTGSSAPSRVPALPPIRRQPMLVVDRPGSVQTSLRLGGAALARDDDRYPALQLANMIFGGYFSSRWVENIREDKGYTYSPRSSIDHARLGSSLIASADVRTEVSAAAMVETLYELGRIATTEVTDTELESVRQYALGIQALSTATQAGLASTLSVLIGAGLDLGWLAEHRTRLNRVTISDVADVAAQFFAPRSLVGVAVGDAAAITGPLSAIVDTAIQPTAAESTAPEPATPQPAGAKSARAKPARAKPARAEPAVDPGR